MIHRPQHFARKDPAPHLPFAEETEAPSARVSGAWLIGCFLVGFIIGFFWEAF